MKLGIDGQKLPEARKRGPLASLDHVKELGLEGIFFSTVLDMSPSLDAGALRDIRAKADDLGAQAISRDLGGLPIVEDASVAPGSVRVVLTADYTGPGSGLDGVDPTLTTADPAAVGSTEDPLASPIITAGSNDPECVK